MEGSGREARRRRILEGGQDRLALITGRKPNTSPSPERVPQGTSPPLDPNIPPLRSSSLPSDQPSVSQNEEDKFSHVMSSRDYPVTKSNQDGSSAGRTKEEPFARHSDSVNQPLRTRSEDVSRHEPPSALQKALSTALDAVMWVAQQIPIGHVTSQQVGVVVAATEHDRMLCAVTMAILVVLSYSGFPILGSRMFRWIILFRPLFLVLVTNITLIVRRLLPDNQKNLVRGDRDNNASLLGDGYAWAEEAGRALEVGLMLQNVFGALFMDCSLYAVIVVFGLALFG